jgi:hypothetical protein
LDNHRVPGRSVWSLTPQQSIEAECARRGRREVIDGCGRLVLGESVDHSLVRALGGPAADKFFDGADHEDLYWFRVWGARGLLWAWDESAMYAVLTALDDKSWRVREMGLKVVARHLLGDALDAAAALRDDSVPRVRAAARRAVVLLTQAGA